MKKFKELGFESEEALDIVNSLNILLANYQIHYQKLRNFHWNVEGSAFFELHEVFENAYNEIKVQIDDTAERIRVFGKKPHSTLKKYLEVAEIKECDNDFSSDQMVGEILSDIDMLISFIVEAYETAALAGDIATTDMLKEFLKWIEKQHWMLSAYNK